MRFHRSPPVAALLALGGLIALAGCSKDSKSNPTTPAALELNSGDLAPAAQYAHRFFTPQAYPYLCTRHSSMTGAVTVSDAAPAGDTLETVSIVGVPSMAFSPASVTIHTGGKVTWTNNDVTTHTVTSN